MPTPSSRRWFVFALIAYWVALTIGTHSPSELMPRLDTDHIDKLYHLSGFGGLAFLAVFAFDVRRYVVAGVLLAGYAAIDESTQAFVGRDVDILDWCANVTGICVGLVLARAIQRWRARRAS